MFGWNQGVRNWRLTDYKRLNGFNTIFLSYFHFFKKIVSKTKL